MKTKKTQNKKSSGGKITGRPKPSSPKAGYSASGRRYGCGGALKK